MVKKSYTWIPEPIEINSDDIKKAKEFLAEIKKLCEKYQLEISGSGDYGIEISKYTDGKYHEDNFIMDGIWGIGPETTF